MREKRLQVLSRCSSRFAAAHKAPNGYIRTLRSEETLSLAHFRDSSCQEQGKKGHTTPDVRKLMVSGTCLRTVCCANIHPGAFAGF